MKKIIVISFLMLTMILASACSRNEEPETIPDKANSDAPSGFSKTSVMMDKVYTDAEEENGWWVVPRDADTITIYVEAQHADTVLFWSSPTGTEVGKERKLIGYDSDGEDGWSLVWDIKDQSLHNHVDVQALGIDGVSLATETFNVHTLEE
ncbi:hypothetical protein PVOR_03958 [Paenibacillus vortex V453]|uniref:Lipoprotein n=1 Tax=Paenibacillus vortex V453 TaxID=715225 RepID=A0A2R9T0R4_9BACL|nr:MULTISPECIES: hypothetical protein [Paenibacillus]EFU43224.1 hypothetical protein PVOR_03958 [Paenibacillus vortex V453]MDH6671290.1 hypothetical protein [Paenibacillus sp. LBL]